MVILGGSGYFWGGLTGAAIYMLLEESISTHTEHWNLWLGAAAVHCPGGARGHHEPAPQAGKG